MKVDLDVARFMELVREGEEEVDETRKMNLWEKACRLYKGELLPMQSGEDWVIMNSVRYKDKYSKILRRLCAYRKEQHEYDTILELTDNAIEIYPFDEWQSLKIDALMGMNRYKEAYQLYDATSKMFFEELGITPSERMMNQFQEMSERMGRKYHAAGEIKEDLKEPEYEDGAFYCSLPSFRDNYRLVRRLIERNGQSAFLMVCSLTDGNGHPMENREKLLIQGVEQVESFDENCVQLDTTLGDLVIRGRGLHIDRIDDVNKEVSVTGEIVAMLYDETRFKGGFLARLMR